MNKVDLHQLVARTQSPTRQEVVELVAASVLASTLLANAVASGDKGDAEGRRDYINRMKDAFVAVQVKLLNFTFEAEDI